MDRKEKELYSLLGKRITQLRKKAGYTSQETFAYDAEIPRALYGRYEKGANLTISSLYRIIKYHEISFEEFFKNGFEDF
jgi:transcriptional regulator with XRE-family HTH domain